MANSWAVVVGINHYEHLPQDNEHQLRCAVSDAERMQDFLCQQAGFDSENVVLCTDSSPAISGLNTRPSRTNLRRLLLELHKRPQAKGAAIVWFFYSGHGISQEGQDYLLMQDGNPEDLKETAVPLRFVMEKLIECRAKTTVLVLDMCRNSVTSGGKGGEETVGMQTIREAQQQGIITLFSCSRGGRSYELPELGQGVFTQALLEGLVKHTLPGQLGDYLRQRVYELTQHKQPVQVPLIALEPDWKYNLPLLPTCITKTDINHLKERATHILFVDQNLDLAEQLWEQVNDLATNAEDKKLSRQLLREIDRKRTQPHTNAPTSTVTEGDIAATLPISTAPKAEPPPVKVQPAPAKPQEPKDDLSSEKGVDYRKLRDLLQQEEWKAADEETHLRMLEAIGRNKGDWIRAEELQVFPCMDLKTIDRLWEKYSNGHFGFSVQQQIWQECGSPTKNDEHWEKLGNSIGWCYEGRWLTYGEVCTEQLEELEDDFNTQAVITRVSSAHLPCCWVWWFGVGIGGYRNEEVLMASGVGLAHLMSRLTNCGDDELSSEKGVDYRKLRGLLKAGKWKDADQETWRVMCQAANRQEESWLRVADIQRFPCTDLRTIDWLWVKYSNGHFGFSVQKKIWQECGSPKSPGRDWDHFCIKVGWQNQEVMAYAYVSYSDFKFSTQKSFVGELPAVRRAGWIRGVVRLWTFFSRAEVCEL